MELKEITNKLKSIPNGANIGITYKSDISKQLNASARKDGHTIEKEGRVVLRKGLKKDRDPENIPGDRSWGKHSSEEENTTNGESFIIEHNGKYYVDFYMGSAGGVGIQAPKYKYFLDGKEVTKEELEPYMQPAAYKRMNAPYNHYSINIDHISDVRYRGRTLEGLNEELDEETYFDFEHEIYGALADVIEKFPGVTANEIERALENFDIRFFEDNTLFDTSNNSTSNNSIDYVNQYELNVLTHVRELEDEGEYEDAEDFRDNFPRLIDYSESGSKITLKFDKPLNKSDLIPYLMYVPKDFSDESEAAAKAINDTTIVVDNALNEALSSNATMYEVVYQDDDGYGVKQTVIAINNADINDYIEYLYDGGFMYCDVISNKPVNFTDADEEQGTINLSTGTISFIDHIKDFYVTKYDSYEKLDYANLEEAYDDYEGGFSDPLESGEYSLSDFGYKNSYAGDHFTSLNKRTSEYHSGARRLARDLKRNNKFSRAANESLTTPSKRKLNEHFSDSDAQKYGYRNAAELKAANSLNENLKKK